MFLFTPGIEPCLHLGEEKYTFFPVRRLKVALAQSGAKSERCTVAESVVRGLAMKETARIDLSRVSGGCRTAFLLAAAYDGKSNAPYAYAAGLWLKSDDPWGYERVYFSPLRAASRTIDPFDTRVWCVEGVRSVFDGIALETMGDIRQAQNEVHTAGELICVGCEVHPAYTANLVFEAGINGVGLLRIQWN